VGVLEALGSVGGLHDGGNGGDVGYVGGFAGAGAASKDVAYALENVGDARTGASFGGEYA